MLNNTNIAAHTMTANIRVGHAVLAGCGDYYATMRTTARFCTEALVDAADAFGCEASGWERHDRRANAVYRLCSYAHAVRLAADGRAIAARVAAERAVAEAERLERVAYNIRCGMSVARAEAVS